MATATLRRKEAVNIIRRKTAFSKEQVEDLMISLNNGKVSYPYFKEIVELMRCRAGRSSFALNNQAEWKYVERRLRDSDLPAVKFAEYFCSDPQTSAEIRAEPDETENHGRAGKTVFSRLSEHQSRTVG